jgi:hypothetical protein
MSYSPNPYESLSDAQLDEHIEMLEQWLAFDEETIAVAVAERNRRGRGGYQLTEAAEAYLSDLGRRAAA